MDQPRIEAGLSEAAFVRRVLIAIGLVALALALWWLREVLLLIFAAVLVAVVLHACADVIHRYTPVPQRWSLLVAGLLIATFFLGTLALFGAQVRLQIANVAERIPFALNTLTKEFGLGGVTEQLPQLWEQGRGLVSRAASFGIALLGGLADLVLVVVAGAFIAGNPRLYRDGLVKLFPTTQHERVRTSLNDAGRALRLWLAAQLIAMACVGVLTALSMWMLGLPSPFALGLIAGLADFIPFVGPIIGALPAVLIAFTIDANTALWTVLIFIGIQQIEANIIFPMVERRVVALPPALALFAILAAGALFGTMGLIVGFPLAVVIFVLVKKLYVRETLGQPTPVPGEPETPGAA
jgi:predicted PurR-regulated permease PerM